MDSISKRARTAFRWTLSLRLLSQIFTWLSSLIVIRFLSPSDYGVVAISETVLMIALQFASAGLGDVLVRQKELNENFIRKVLFLLVSLNTSLAILQLLLASHIAAFYEQPIVEFVLYSTSIIFVAMPWVTLSANLLAREFNFKSRSKIDFTASLTSSILALALAYNGMGFWSLIISNIANIVIKAVFYNITLGRLYLPKIDTSGMFPSIKFGAMLMVSGLLFTMFMKVDILIAGKYIDASTLGIYAVAMHLALMPMTKIMPLINEVAYPLYSSIQHEKDNYTHTFCYILRIVTIFCFPVFYGFSAVSQELVFIALGSNWEGVYIPLQIILLTIPFRVISYLFTPLTRALGFPSTDLIHISFSIIITAICIFISARFGVNALATSWIISTPISFFFAIYLCSKISGINKIVIFQTVLPPLAASITMFSIIALLREVLNVELNVFIRLLIFVVIGAISYMTIFKTCFKERFNEAIKFRL